MTMVLTIFIKYVLHSVDLQSENPWDNKAVYMLYTELFTGNRILGLSRSTPASCSVSASPVASCRLPFLLRLYQGPAVHGLYDHHDQGAHISALCH